MQFTKAIQRSTQVVTVVIAVALAIGASGCSKSLPWLSRAGADASPSTASPSASSPAPQDASPSDSPPVLEGTPDIAQIARTLRPSVVNITTKRTMAVPTVSRPMDFFFGLHRRHPSYPWDPGERDDAPVPHIERKSLGSGFIIDADGSVLTNDHVVAGADSISVRLSDGRSVPAKIIGRDARLDIALIKLVQQDSKLSPAVMGDSDKLSVGEYVVAIGNPYGLGNTVTMGIVSAKDRTLGAGPYDDFIQTDASINPGNSGGPLFNLRGEVVGINTAVHAEAQGIGFAIPVNLARDVLDQLRESGHVARGKLGVEFQPLTPGLAQALGLERPRGALVDSVEPGGPADRAGLASGDVIVRFDGTVVEKGHDLPRLVARCLPGTKVRLTYLREHEEQSAEVTLGLLDAPREATSAPSGEPAAQSAADPFGMQLAPSDHGVQVERVGAAADGQLMPGDFIVAVGGKAVHTPPEVRQALAEAAKREQPALLKVRRRGHDRFVALQAPS